MPTLYLGRLMTAPQPFTTVADTWSAFEVLAVNNIPAITGQRFHTVSSGWYITYSSSPPPPTRQSNTRIHALGSAFNLLIMNAAEADRDPFSEDESGWPLQYYEEVYIVTTTQVCPLLTSLITSSARAQAPRAHGGHCLNCNGTNHSMKAFSQYFLYTSGILNPVRGHFKLCWTRLLAMVTTDALVPPGTARAQPSITAQTAMLTVTTHRGTHHNNNRSRGHTNNHSNHDHSYYHRANNGRSNNGRSYDSSCLGSNSSNGEPRPRHRLQP